MALLTMRERVRTMGCCHGHVDSGQIEAVASATPCVPPMASRIFGDANATADRRWSAAAATAGRMAVDLVTDVGSLWQIIMRYTSRTIGIE